jgi:hypothetical protein
MANVAKINNIAIASISKLTGRTLVSGDSINGQDIAATTVFKTLAYSGTGAGGNAVTGAGFQPDFGITKKRSAGQQFNLQDATRGTGVALASPTEAAQATGLTDYITSFDADGITLGANSAVNQAASTYQSFLWKKLAGYFDIVTYTGTGIAKTEAHALGVAPTVMLVKSLSAIGEWSLYDFNSDATAPEDYATTWGDGTGANLINDTAYWNGTAPTSSVFSVGTIAATNGLLTTYIAYLFAAVAGKSAFGTYTGNGNASGPVVSLSFTPTLVIIIKRIASGDNVTMIYGNTASVNLADIGAESATNFADLNASDFTIKSTSGSVNTNAAVYMYMAWA